MMQLSLCFLPYLLTAENNEENPVQNKWKHTTGNITIDAGG